MIFRGPCGVNFRVSQPCSHVLMPELGSSGRSVVSSRVVQVVKLLLGSKADPALVPMQSPFDEYVTLAALLGWGRRIQRMVDLGDFDGKFWPGSSENDRF